MANPGSSIGPALRASLGCLAMIVLAAFPAAAQGPGETRLVGGVPGRFDYYTLVLSWSPTHCAELDRNDRDPQCRMGRGYAFVLHGLWPQYERGFPRSCPTGHSNFVPQPVIDRMQDIMPSPKLTIHEYRMHGTCSGLDPAGYFDLARRLFERIKIPQRYVKPQADQMVGAGELLAEFLAANPGLKPEMLAVACGGAGNRLKDVRVCFTREGTYRSCGANESQPRLCQAGRLHVPPVRIGTGTTVQPGRPRGGVPLPVPGPGLRSL